MIGHVQLGSATLAAVVLSLVSAPSTNETPKTGNNRSDPVNTQSPKGGPSTPV